MPLSIGALQPMDIPSKNSKGSYEYAVLNTDGSLALSGVQAKNIKDRNINDQIFLGSIDKNLFFSKEQVD